MTNLIVLCIKIRNAGLDDQGLLSHLSEVTAGGVRGMFAISRAMLQH